MRLVQILLPVSDNDGRPQPPVLFAALETELTERFGGMTAYAQAPARGKWKEASGDVARDEIVIFEVMAQDLDPDYWACLRQRLERDFRQASIVIRATAIERL